jgi:hypothetical protein
MTDDPHAERMRRHEAILEDLACRREGQHAVNRQQVERHQEVNTTLAGIETLRARRRPTGENGRDA